MIKDGQFYIDFPEPYKRRELNSKYREIPLKDTTSRQLRKYFNAMANLYGIIPLRKAYEIISSQSPKLVTRDEFLAFAEIARHECEDYYILGLDELYVDGELKDVLDREIIDVSLIGDGLDRYHALLKSQQGKPYYVPSKAELLAYDDAFYCEPTEETKVPHQSPSRYIWGAWSAADASGDKGMLNYHFGLKLPIAAVEKKSLLQFGDFPREG